MKKFKEFVIEKKSDWSVILNAYGDWERIDGFSTKKDAVFHIQSHLGVGTNQKKLVNKNMKLKEVTW